MITNSVIVTHEWFDYIKNHTDINLEKFSINIYSNWISIDFNHAPMSYYDSMHISPSELIKLENVSIGFFLPEVLFKEGIPHTKVIKNYNRFGGYIPHFAFTCYWQETEHGDEFIEKVFTHKPVSANEQYTTNITDITRAISEGKRAYKEFQKASKKSRNKYNKNRAKYAYALKMIDGKVNAN